MKAAVFRKPGDISYDKYRERQQFNARQFSSGRDGKATAACRV